MVQGGVLSCRQLDLRCALSTQRLVSLKVRRHVFCPVLRSISRDAVCNHNCILERHARPLSDEGKHRMTRITQERGSALAPPRQRIAVKQRPSRSLVVADGREKLAYVRIPPLERGDQLTLVPRLSPRLSLVPVALRHLDDRDNIYKRPTAHKVVHKMRARPDPDRCARPYLHNILQLSGGDQCPPRHAPGKPGWRLGREESTANS
mmetsp:Transcript_12832/g.34546  ORF Transcript_12832/g.34546 Transcript_12832/m.34546 type:complete len:206 (-) Transcript_12832:615-1232(-)